MRSACSGLYSSGADLRPKRGDFTTLWPDRPLYRQVDLSDIVKRLPDGVYNVELESLGAWWCWGSVEEIFADEEVIPHALYNAQVPPLRLWSVSKLRLKVEGGMCEPGSTF